jgi:hypothetical protein
LESFGTDEGSTFARVQMSVTRPPISSTVGISERVRLEKIMLGVTCREYHHGNHVVEGLEADPWTLIIDCYRHYITQKRHYGISTNSKSQGLTAWLWLLRS